MRTSARTRITATAVGSVSLAASLLAGAAPAQAAGCAPVIDKVTVRDVVIYGTIPSRLTTTVVAHDPCSDSEYSTPGIADVSGDAYLSDGDSWGVYFNHATGSTWSGASGAYFDKYSATGRGSLNVEVNDSDYNTTYRDGVPFYVRRNVTMNSFNAAPEPVRKGSPVTVSGLVKRLSVNSWGDARYVPYVSHSVHIYFRASTSKTYTKVATTSTTSNGTFAKKITATVDGCWKAYSTQTSYNVGRWSTGDCVDVR